MKKTMSVLLAAAMCSAMLAGCGSTAADTAADASAETTAAAATEAADSSASAEGVNVFKIGGTSPLTGAAAIYGNAVKNGAQTVSYTHLDVYKRQVQTYRSAIKSAAASFPRDSCRTGSRSS